MLGRKTTVTVFVGLVLVLGAHTAVADEGGTFFMVRSYQHSYITVEHSDESYTGGILRGTQTVLDSSGGPFADSMNSTLECLVFSRSSDAGLTLEAPCVGADLDGDLLYTTAVRGHGTVGTGGGAGRWEIRGGTGKYAGITGICDYDTQYLANDQVVTTGECTWSKS
ncbi:MAG: hypothetical protein OXP69_02910 [Spirochaetaceae bacterium]|nr:hypothetical protein [Spirochaetaceae bacterium]